MFYLWRESHAHWPAVSSPSLLHCFSDSFFIHRRRLCACPEYEGSFREAPSLFTEIHLHHLPFSFTYSHTHLHIFASSPLKPAPTASNKSSTKACRATNTTKTWHFRCSEAARAARSRRGPALWLFLLDLHALPSQALPAAVLVVVFLQSASIVSGFSIGGP